MTGITTTAAVAAERVQVLVAVDPGNGDFDGLLSRMGEAVRSTATVSQPHRRTGEPQTVHRIVFASRELRNTVAHGMACTAGFLVHVEAVSLS